MKKIILIFSMFMFLFLIGCGVDLSKADLSKLDVNKAIICEKPYIRHGYECCLDLNENKVCDQDENKDSGKGSSNIGETKSTSAVENNNLVEEKKPQEKKLEEEKNLVNEEKKDKILPLVEEVESEIVKGDATAPVTIIEFTDFQCPSCQKAWGVMKQVETDYVAKGKVKLVFKNFPLDIVHPMAQASAQAGECAHEQDKFWEYHDKLFANQLSLSDENLKKWAKEVGLDESKFNSCFDNKKYESKVAKDQQEGLKAGVQGTPAFLINGQLYSGALPYAQFKQLIEAELAKTVTSILVKEDTKTIVKVEPSEPLITIDLANYPALFITKGSFNGITIVGDTASASDTLTGIDITNSLSASVPVTSSKLSSEVADIKAQNSIIIGNPCKNPFSAELLGHPSNCLDGFTPGQAIIKLFETGNKVSLLVAGFSDDDTRAAGKALANYKTNQLSGKQVTIERVGGVNDYKIIK